jgi:hypothetical protein
MWTESRRCNLRRTREQICLASTHLKPRGCMGGFLKAFSNDWALLKANRHWCIDAQYQEDWQKCLRIPLFLGWIIKNKRARGPVSGCVNTWYRAVGGDLAGRINLGKGGA